MHTMTIRNVSPEVAAALDEEKRSRGLSLNRTVLALIEESLGANGNTRSNGPPDSTEAVRTGTSLRRSTSRRTPASP